MKISSVVVLGEGMAGGMGDFSLSSDSQNNSFPAQAARQMGVTLNQPLFEPPGLGGAIGFEPWPVIVPSPWQSTVFVQPVAGPIHNLSVPGLTVAEALRLRPQEPLIDRSNARQTMVNLILGMPHMAEGNGDLRTPLERAIALQPTLAVVELGYSEILKAAARGDAGDLDEASFAADYVQIVKGLRQSATEVIVLTIPDPLTTAFCSSSRAAAEIVKLDPGMLEEFWGIHAGDYVTPIGLNEIAFQIFAASVGPSTGFVPDPLPAGSVLPSETAALLSARVQSLNGVITQIAQQQGARLLDLCGLLRTVSNAGVKIGDRNLAGTYLGGFYSLNGCYPGACGQAVIANHLLSLLNDQCGCSLELINLSSILGQDQVAGYKGASGRNWTRDELQHPSPLPGAPATADPTPAPAVAADVPIADNPNHILKLPPGLEQVLPLNPELSYFGDALSAQHCRTPEQIRWGSGNNLYFGGLALMDSHLSGNMRVRFTAPDGDWSSFQISFENGLQGSDASLAAPFFFKMPGRKQLVTDVPGRSSGGRLNLRTGEVDLAGGSLNIYAGLFNSALFALVQVNPRFPSDPPSFPGKYGSALLEFEPRSDGKLDITFQGTTFVPLGEGAFFPLNFCGPNRQFASIPANGLVLHPRLVLSTKASAAPSSVSSPEIPLNTLQEFTLISAASSFGNLFALNTPELAGPGLGRWRICGRLQVQFGMRSGNSVPVAFSTSAGGGLLMSPATAPVASLFPGKLTPGPVGFNELLRFPLRSYSLSDLTIINDPFDLSIGAVDVRTGRLIHPLLHRGFVDQALIYALLRVEPRTPTSSFFFRGPGQFRSDEQGSQVFDFFGTVHIPYPRGFLFPYTNLATGFPVQDGGSLDPHLWYWAVKHGELPHPTAIADHSLSSQGEEYSYRLSLPVQHSERAEFEYENHDQQGSFRMHCLTWIGHCQMSLGGEVANTITFSGFGKWSKDGVEHLTQASVQISISPSLRFVGIQIGPGGAISNVNSLAPLNALPLPEPATFLAASAPEKVLN